MSFETKLLGFFEHKNYQNYPKPNSRKNFIRNYDDHLNYLIEVQLADKIKAFDQAQTFQELFNLFNDDELLNHCLVFDKLRDGHDYLDEVGGVLVAPFLGLGASALSLGLATYEMGVALGIQCHIIDNDDEKHGFNAGKYLVAAVASLALSLACAAKSALSLITRPLISLVAEQELDAKERFRDENRGAFRDAGNTVRQLFSNTFT